MTHKFMMILDGSATPTPEAIMASGMSQRFPECDFEIKRTRNPEYADIVIPVGRSVSRKDEIDSFTVFSPPEELTEDVRDVFSEMLREAKEVKMS